MADNYATYVELYEASLVANRARDIPAEDELIGQLNDLWNRMSEEEQDRCNAYEAKPAHG